MNSKIKRIMVSSLILVFSINFSFAFLIYPEIGEKILYGKHPPGKPNDDLEYSEIILTGDYDCMEIASKKANGSLPEFVKEFNKCHI